MSCETKYILGGGFMEKASDGGKSYCGEIVEGIKPPIKILECMFAIPKDSWQASIDKNKSLFSTVLPDLKTRFTIADRSEFVNQISEANVVIFRGGSTRLLLDSLDKFGNLATAFCTKTIVGLSAGAYALSKEFLEVSNEGDIGLGKGLAILPFRVIVHYRSRFYVDKFPFKFSWDKVDDLFGNSDDNLKLKEGHFKVYNFKNK